MDGINQRQAPPRVPGITAVLLSNGREQHWWDWDSRMGVPSPTQSCHRCVSPLQVLGRAALCDQNTSSTLTGWPSFSLAGHRLLSRLGTGGSPTGGAGTSVLEGWGRRVGVPSCWPRSAGTCSGAKGGELAGVWLGTMLHPHPHPHPPPAGICFSLYPLSCPGAARHLDSGWWLLLICN